MSDRSFFVLCRETCRTCRGSGVIANPVWERYFAEAQDILDPDHWALEAGLGSARAMGPEEIPCADCEGEGRREYPVSLADALAELGLLFRMRKL
jgi:hypothetical protein